MPSGEPALPRLGSSSLSAGGLGCNRRPVGSVIVPRSSPVPRVACVDRWFDDARFSEAGAARPVVPPRMGPKPSPSSPAWPSAKSCVASEGERPCCCSGICCRCVCCCGVCTTALPIKRGLSSPLAVCSLDPSGAWSASFCHAGACRLPGDPTFSPGARQRMWIRGAAYRLWTAWQTQLYTPGSTTAPLRPNPEKKVLCDGSRSSALCPSICYPSCWGMRRLT